MEKQKTMYAVILNFESGMVDALVLDNKPESMDTEEYIEDVLDYSLSNCEWMITPKPFVHNLNF